MDDHLTPLGTKSIGKVRLGGRPVDDVSEVGLTSELINPLSDLVPGSVSKTWFMERFNEYSVGADQITEFTWEQGHEPSSGGLIGGLPEDDLVHFAHDKLVLVGHQSLRDGILYPRKTISSVHAEIWERPAILTTGWKIMSSVIPATADPAIRAVPDSLGSFPSAGGDILMGLRYAIEVEWKIRRKWSSSTRSRGLRGRD
jgi:hypothetical protein